MGIFADAREIELGTPYFQSMGLPGLITGGNELSLLYVRRIALETLHMELKHDSENWSGIRTNSIFGKSANLCIFEKNYV